MRIGLSRYTSDPPREKGFQRLSSLYITHYKLYAIQSLSNSLSLSLSLSLSIYLYQTIRSCATWFLIYVVICIVRGFGLDKMKDVFFFAREIGVVENLARVLPDKKVWNKVQKLVNNAYDVIKRIHVENIGIKRVRKMSGIKYCNDIRVTNSIHLVERSISLNALST